MKLVATPNTPYGYDAKGDDIVDEKKFNGVKIGKGVILDGHFVRTSVKLGLTPSDVDVACALLSSIPASSSSSTVKVTTSTTTGSTAITNTTNTATTTTTTSTWNDGHWWSLITTEMVRRDNNDGSVVTDPALAAAMLATLGPATTLSRSLFEKGGDASALFSSLGINDDDDDDQNFDDDI
jgi:hypothetical protein